MPLHRGNSLSMFCYFSPLLCLLSLATFKRFLLLSSSSSSSSLSLPLKLLYSLLFSASIYLRYARAFSRFVVMVIRWERRFDRKVSHKLEILREIPTTGSRRIRTDPESSRSLSALINVVSLLIYRRVAGEPTNEIRRYHARTTLGIPWPGSLDKL